MKKRDIKLRNKRIAITAMAAILSMNTLVGCSKLSDKMIEAMNNQVDIELSVEKNSYNVERAPLGWIELGQMTSHPKLRDVWEDKTNVIVFDINSKNGCLYVDTDAKWSGNNTLYNVFQNKAFVLEYWRNSKFRSNLAQAAIEEYSDIKNESNGIIAAVNGYFSILPENKNETSGLSNILTRAEVLSAIYRGDTPVILLDEKEDFKNAVGESDYNVYAQEVADISYLDYRNGSLNKLTYNSSITRAEAIYMLVQRYYKEEYDSMGVISGGSIGDCKNAGNVAEKQKFLNGYSWQTYELEYCLQNRDKGLTEPLYRAIAVANKHGIISTDTRWDEGLYGGEFLTWLVAVYDELYNDNNFLVNAKFGENVGEQLVEQPVEEKPEIIEETITSEVVVQKIKDISDIDDLIKVYGNELEMSAEEIEEAKKAAEGYTIAPCDKYMLVDYCNYLNVRVGPSTDYKIKKSVPKGTQVHIVGRCVENGWYRVIADGKIAYQCGVYFSDLEGQDTSNLVQEYETKSSKETTAETAGTDEKDEAAEKEEETAEKEEVSIF